MSDVHVIAEAGTNHNGDVGMARQLVDGAVAAGADAVKFQAIFPAGLYLPEFFVDGEYEANEVFELRERWKLGADEFREIAAYCSEQGIAFSASIFDEEGLNLLDSLEVPYFKFASCDLNNTPFLRLAAERGRRMVVATGMSTLEEIDEAVRAITATGNEDIVLLHCVSRYPCPLDSMNLGFLRELKSAFGLPVGLSDHTESSHAAAMAVALGATYVEKHFTHDRSAEGFDHAYAMEPEDLAGFVADVRAASAAIGPRDKVGLEEAEVKERVRRGLYAARDLDPATKLGAGDILVVRPEGPLAPRDLDAITGRETSRQILKFEPLSWEAVK